MSKKTSPLVTLIARLRSLGPPSISALIAKFGDVEEYQSFVMLIREFIPEYEAEILLETSQGAQILRFASRFADRYFPLAIRDYPWEDIEYCDLTRQIPVEIGGWTWDEYENIPSDARAGLQLLAYMLERPYDNDELVSLAEACAEHVPKDMLMRIPEGGIKADQVHELFDNTPYKPIAMLCDWLCANTGNFFLDTDYEFLSYNMAYPDWAMETVQQLTRHWQQKEQILEEIDNFFEWLEGDPKARFKEILDFAEKGVK